MFHDDGHSVTLHHASSRRRTVAPRSSCTRQNICSPVSPYHSPQKRPTNPCRTVSNSNDLYCFWNLNRTDSLSHTKHLLQWLLTRPTLSNSPSKFSTSPPPRVFSPTKPSSVSMMPQHLRKVSSRSGSRPAAKLNSNLPWLKLLQPFHPPSKAFLCRWLCIWANKDSHL